MAAESGGQCEYVVLEPYIHQVRNPFVAPFICSVYLYALLVYQGLGVITLKIVYLNIPQDWFICPFLCQVVFGRHLVILVFLLLVF